MRPLIFLLITAAACTRDTAPETPVLVVDTSASGVVHVRNHPDSAALQPSWRYELSHVIAPAEGSPGELSELQSFVADSAGNVYVLQTKPAVIRVFDSLGHWQRDIGREGDGPGEFRSGMLAVSGDTLYVQDWQARRLLIFTTTGEALAVHPSRCCTYLPRLPVFRDGTVGVPGPSRTEHFWHRMNVAGATVDSFPLDPFNWRLSSTAWRATRRVGNREEIRQVQPPNTIVTHVAQRSDLTAAWGTTSSYTFAIGMPPHDTARVVTMPFTPRVLSASEREALFESLLTAMEPEWQTAFREVASLEDMPAEVPAWELLLTDGDEVVVVMLDERRRDATVDRFAPDGTFRFRASAPAAAMSWGLFLGDRLYARSETDDGFPTIQVYQLVRGTP